MAAAAAPTITPVLVPPLVEDGVGEVDAKPATPLLGVVKMRVVDGC